MTYLLALVSDLPVLAVAPAEVLIEEGTRPSRMFVLQKGAMVIEHGGVPFARVDTPGAVFGEMAAVLQKPATATVRAVGDVEVRVIEDPVVFLTERPGAALAILRITVSRLDGLTQYLGDLRTQLTEAGGDPAMLDRVLDELVHHQGPVARTGSARDPEGDRHSPDEESAATRHP